MNPQTAAIFARCRRATIAFDQFVPSEAFSLDDLAVLKNLTHISMFASTIDDFSFIPTLPRLESLALDMCTSDDYSSIFVSPSLKSLKIEAEDEFGTDEDTAAPIDLTGIDRMTELETLEIKSDGEIIGISKIASMTALKHLKFQVPQNGDLSILSPLTNLETLVLLDAYGMTLDISPLSDKIHLKKFSFNGASIADPTPFGTMISLQTLNLSGMSLTDISALSGMTGLEYLKLSNNDITDISPLSTMPNLIWVELENNRISDLSPLSDKAQLHQLRLTNNMITDLSGLKNLPALEYLFIRENPITSVTPLASLPALSDLRIDETAIDDRAHISHIKSLNTNNDYWGGSPFN
ncbi:MAG: leucine-rich repeat domain-containing protein [Clostridia bacterium]|nr:leucine-rich repeat domain-containing protein [Clostridia bacterium]